MAGAQGRTVQGPRGADACGEAKGALSGAAQERDSQHVFGAQLKAMESTVNVSLHAPREWELLFFSVPAATSPVSPEEVPNK